MGLKYGIAKKMNTLRAKGKELFTNHNPNFNFNMPKHLENQNKIIISNFYKRYARSDVFADCDVNLEINAGTVFGLLGPNGSGKSSLIKAMVGIHPLSGGTIEIAGYDIVYQEKQAKQLIGFVPDHYGYNEAETGLEYLNFVADQYCISSNDRFTRINHWADRLNITSALSSPIGTFSHGMKQKLAIIASLITDPKVWILDEPLTGLDPDAIKEVKTILQEFARSNRIVMFSSHLMEVSERLCDEIAIIKNGHIIAKKDMSYITANHGTLEGYYRYITEHIQTEPTSLPSDFTSEEVDCAIATQFSNKKKYKIKKAAFSS
jgi:ABC-2 type transport system ATP-binding protein